MPHRAQRCRLSARRTNCEKPSCSGEWALVQDAEDETTPGEDGNEKCPPPDRHEDKCNTFGHARAACPCRSFALYIYFMKGTRVEVTRMLPRVGNHPWRGKGRYFDLLKDFFFFLDSWSPAGRILGPICCNYDNGDLVLCNIPRVSGSNIASFLSSRLEQQVGARVL